MPGNIAVGDPLVRIDDMLLVFFGEEDNPLRAEDLHPRTLAEARVLLRKRIVHAEAHDRAVGKGQDRPGHVIRAVSRGLKHPLLAARHHLGRGVARRETSRRDPRNRSRTSRTGEAWGERLRIWKACAREL